MGVCIMNNYENRLTYNVVPFVLAFILSLLAWMMSAPVKADEPTELTGKVGCILTWNFPADQEKHVGAFPIWIDGQWRKAMPPSARSVNCEDVGMSTPGTYRLEMFTRAKPDSGHSNSVRVAFNVTLEPAMGTPATAPSNIQLLPQPKKEKVL